jgi:hypothetical protein
MAIADIYNFEGCVEPAVKAVLAAATPPINCFTSQDIVDFQKVMPRVEVQFTLGAGENRFDPAALLDPATGLPPVGISGGNLLYQYRRECAWSCTLTFDCITLANMVTHAPYRTYCRFVLANLGLYINNTPTMKRHNLTLSRDMGNTPFQSDQDNQYYRTTMAYNGKLSVLSTAWTALVPGLFYSPATATIFWTDKNGRLSGDLAHFNATADLVTVSSIDVDGQGLTSLSNLNVLPALTYIDCDSNSLTYLDVSGNPLLTTLICSYNALPAYAVNTILSGLVANGKTGGAVDTVNQTPSAIPSHGPPDGIAAAAALRAETPVWTVTTD